MIAKRVFSTLLLWGTIIGTLSLCGFEGGVWLIAIFGAFTQNEMYVLLKKIGRPKAHKIGTVLGFIFPLAVWYLSPSGENTLDILALFVLIICVSIIFQPSTPLTYSSLGTTLYGFFYVSFNLHFLLYLVNISGKVISSIPVLWVIAVAKFTDVGALLLGLLIGKRKLAPNISPAKTWEGVFGGIIMAVTVGAIISSSFKNAFPGDFNTTKSILLSIPIAVVAILSDLIESSLKRLANVKDSGRLFPGIGGAFDLTDSLILTAPLSYLLLKHFA